ncbi:MAG: queuine tRNA-ribosyltransferase [Acidimicrobiaceae bacterium]|jgi:queuine tRNA-ribosyltransferase|nr:queuine tRNA-ribosyltransferase [Acidimicrobiaceae bacterium]MDQ1441251.1 queuine tRNA-ribosyltransferase [Acidimicrobiaceae bacterium]
MTAALRFDVGATDGSARTGFVHTARGVFPTPCFMPVGTRGTVRTLDAADLSEIGADVLLANTYHLMLRPGAEVVAAAGGLHGFSGWDGHMLTDSGGYQVFSLGPQVDDEGVTFRSTYDGSVHRLTPEGAVAIQEVLGADIQMALDICPALPSAPEVLRAAVERTAAWAARARRAHHREGQAIFGIVQGGADEALRAESAARTVELDFDGYGIGGLSVGEPRSQMLPALAAALAELPADGPRYLMGVGDPVSIVEAVALGVDMFDCVLPTRLGRHGTALTGGGKVQIRGAALARDLGPIDEGCGCRTCTLHSRSYLRHLFMVGEPSGPRLLTWHNLAWQLRLMADIRDAVAAGRLGQLRARLAATWG